MGLAQVRRTERAASAFLFFVEASRGLGHGGGREGVVRDGGRPDRFHPLVEVDPLISVYVQTSYNCN